MKRRTRLMAVILAVWMLIAAFGIQAFAAQSVPIQFGLEASSTRMTAGTKFRVNVNLNFGDDFIEANGITVLRFGLKYDPALLDLLDPYSMEPITSDDNGDPVGGGYYKFGDIGLPDSLSVAMAQSKDTLVVLYGGRDEAGDMKEPGAFVQFAFRIKEDAAITESLATALEIINPEVSVNNREIKPDPSGDKLYITMTPPFALPNIGSQKQNTVMQEEGRVTFSADSNIPLTAELRRGGTVVAEPEVKMLSTKRYQITQELSEELFTPGTYQLVLRYGDSSASKTFEVHAKDEPLPDPPKPTTPTEPTNPNNPGNSGNSGTSGTDGSGNLPLNPKPSTEPNDPTKPDDTQDPAEPQKPTVTYPKDISRHWANDNIRYVYEHQLMNGYEDNTFLPDKSITRAEFAAVMMRFLGLSQDTAAADKFGDANGHWAKGYIGALAKAGVVGGVSDTAFEPDTEITREQIAVILSRAFSLAPAPETGSFADDAAISDWAYSGVYSVLAAGYMQGDNGNFEPLANATRAEVATVMYRLHTSKTEE